jgi:hypothetical protein
MTSQNSISSTMSRYRFIEQAVDSCQNRRLSPFGIAFLVQVAKDQFHMFPSAMVNSEVAAIAVAANGLNLKNVLTKLRTESLCFSALLNCGRALEHVPKEMISVEFCHAAILQDSSALEFVPNELLTEEMCILAIRRGANKCVKLIPSKFRTDFINMVIEKSLAQQDFENVANNLNGLWDIPVERRTAALCEKAVEHNRYSLGHVPKDLLTAKLVRKAVMQYSDVLELIMHTPFFTKELCVEAIENDPTGIMHVPQKWRTPEMYMSVVKRYGRYLSCVPLEMRTKEMCDAAEPSTVDLENVPEQWRTKELCESVIFNGGSGFEFVPPQFITEDLCEAHLLSNRSSDLKHIPEQFRTPRICKLALYNTAPVSECMPENLRTPELYSLAIGLHSWAANDIPDEMITLNHCLQAARDHEDYTNVPEYMIDMIAKNIFLPES